MKLILIILACIFIGIPVLIGFASLCYTSFMLITGRMTKQQLADMVTDNKAKNAKRKAAKSNEISSGYSYPSPLNKMFWP